MQTQAFLNAYLSDVELAVWRGFFRVHSRLVRELDRELETKHGLPLTQFEVLIHLAKTPDGRTRMSELATTALLSQSGLTRLVDRLERDGLVVREPCADDRRGLHARITDEGRRRVTEALPTHFDDVRARFFAHLDNDDLRMLVGLWERVQPGVTGA
jgi:DNA-binding MarR family transcriptional regulator